MRAIDCCGNRVRVREGHVYIDKIGVVWYKIEIEDVLVAVLVISRPILNYYTLDKNDRLPKINKKYLTF